MAADTTFFVVSYVRSSDGGLLAEQPIEVGSTQQARALAEEMIKVKAGVMAFAVTLDRFASAQAREVFLRLGSVAD